MTQIPAAAAAGPSPGRPPAPWWSYALLLAAALGWSLGGVFIKSASLSGPVIAFYRCAVAAVFLAPMAWRQRRPLDRRQLEAAAAYTATVVLLVLATKRTTAANAILLHYTAPLYVFVAGVRLLGERPARRDWLCLGVALAGVACICSGAGGADTAGIGYGLASGMAYALLILLLRRERGRRAIWVTFANNAAAALVLLPWVRHGLAASQRDLLLMLAMGVVQLAVPYVLFSKAIAHLAASEAALILLLEPMLNPVWVALAVGETPGGRTLIGGTCVLAALAARYLRLAPRPPLPTPAPRA